MGETLAVEDGKGSVVEHVREVTVRRSKVVRTKESKRGQDWKEGT